MNTTLITNDRCWAKLAPTGYYRHPPAGIGEPTPPAAIPRNSILLGDATEQLRTLPPARSTASSPHRPITCCATTE